MKSKPKRQGLILWESYVGRGAPSNKAGAKSGLGRTKLEASQRANHWANQGAWERFRRVALIDHDPGSQRLILEDWRFAEDSGQREVAALFEAGRYASGWLALTRDPK